MDSGSRGELTGAALVGPLGPCGAASASRHLGSRAPPLLPAGVGRSRGAGVLRSGVDR
jgi:hypothetical protein